MLGYRFLCSWNQPLDFVCQTEGSLDSIRLKVVTLRLVARKREVPRSKEDTSGVSAKGTPILKSVMAITSVSYRSGYSGDPDRLYYKWSRRVDMLRAYWYQTSIRRVPRALSVWVVGVMCCATVLLSVDAGRHGKDSTGPAAQAKVQLWSGKCYPDQYHGT
ncbi:hypothetical protein TIFTF001_005060 [Ficus carica]|uniref:Uncharacterized protein n=1 Tax=Ficus carica TaxID=3494 RepID=A0AA87ZL83_FICCA|nr:hypothetical protein TIFTF001_005060 [Ficus carica]